jgi:hypothetical protein
MKSGLSLEGYLRNQLSDKWVIYNPMFMDFTWKKRIWEVNIPNRFPNDLIINFDKDLFFQIFGHIDL